LAFVWEKPKAFYRRFQLNFNQWNTFFVDGTTTGIGGNVNANTQFKNMWFMYGGIGGERSSFCGACLRGGPLLAKDATLNAWGGISGDSRKALVPGIGFSYGRSDGGRSSYFFAGPSVQLRIASRFSTSLGLSYNRNVSDRQWLSNFGVIGSDTTHYTVGHLHQETLSLTARLNFTASPTLSFQFYGSPFVSAGDYADWREVQDGVANDYDARYRPFTGYGNVDRYNFNFKQFRSNTVVRWEYRPGSTLFLVWGQARDEGAADVGQFGGMRDYRNLFRAHPRNTFLIKGSYWLAL
jgi:hypothetical protein